MTIDFSFLFVLLGALIWVFGKPAKVSEFGRIMLIAGMLAVAMHFGGRSLHLP